MKRKDLKLHLMNYLGGKISCQEFTEALTDYLEGKQSLMTKIRFQMHLGMVQGCRVYLKQMKQTTQTLGKLPKEPMPSAVREELLHRFRGWKN